MTPNAPSLRPDYIFEISWEVCNKVGGIHTVIATKTLSLVKEWEDNYILIGPDVWKGTGEHPEFSEDPELMKGWKEHAANCGFKIRIGRWKITGNPLVILIDFTSLFTEKNEIFKNLWLDFQVDSLSGQWDYSEPALFGYSAGQVIECFYHYHITLSDRVVAQFHEWLTVAGILYLESNVPQIGTIFTTHATVTGRSIAGNDLPFYSKLESFNGDLEARKWNVVSKHSLEKAGAKYTDCFTTVSEITAKECRQFLGRSPDILTPNGFDDTIVPDSYVLKQKRNTARKKLLRTASFVTQSEVQEDSLLVLKSGRYEFRNKGIDVFIEAMKLLSEEKELNKDIIAFICIPAHHTGPRKDLQDKLSGIEPSERSGNRFLTHHLQGIDTDPIMNCIQQQGLKNNREDKVKIIFVPVYLDGHDGIFNLTYYDLLPGFDISAFPSYYEPWGYTPLESLAYRIPPITTDVAGFGQFIKGLNSGVYVLHRDDFNTQETIREIAGIIKNYATISEEEVKQSGEAAFSLSKLALWKKMIVYYRQAYSIALKKTIKRAHLFQHQPDVKPLQIKALPIALSNHPIWRKIFIQPTYPEELQPLKKLAGNLWWSWNRKVIELFDSIDPKLWQETGKNPIKLLNTIPLLRIKQLMRDKSFIKKLKEADDTFEKYMAEKPDKKEPQIAYFCMEYGLETNLRLYSGGLGILAGDYLKEASDTNKKILGIGLLYRKGYFKQHLSMYGDQLSEKDIQKFTHLPLNPVKTKEGEWVKVNLAFPGRTLYAKVWQVPVGRTSLFLLDTDIPENRKEDRIITDHLYAGDSEYRLKQELLLGIGGVKLLHTLNIHPDLYHCNEGHAAFMGMERLYQHILEENIPFDVALEVVRASTLFTTHTPVEAAHDQFSEEILRAYLAHYTELFNISWNQLIGLGRKNISHTSEKFSMSYLAARIAQEINGVSKINGEVSRKIFHPLWEAFTIDELHIGHATNGVHYDTWVATEWHELYMKELGASPREKLTENTYWKKITEVQDKLLWQTHTTSKSRLINKVKKKVESDLTAHHQHYGRITDQLQFLNAKTMFIGFARRFVPYKRATLLFDDLQRLEHILSLPNRPVVILFAGKAHPNDEQGQHLIKRIVSVGNRREFMGKIIFLENYDMELARYLVQGVDLWLNTPERGMEASGTSGMKAALNGVLNFSVLDGWWGEAYDSDCGWALENNPYSHTDFSDEIDAQDIYQTLEAEIIPAYFERSNDIPLQWTGKMKASIAKIIPRFNTLRMLTDYDQLFYSKQFNRSVQLRQNNFEKARELVQWKRKLKEAWPKIKVESINIFDSSNKALPLGECYQAEIDLFLNGLSEQDIGVEIVFIEKRGNAAETQIIFSQEMKISSKGNSLISCLCEIPMTRSGVYEYGIRLYPKHLLLPHRQDFPLMTWL